MMDENADGVVCSSDAVEEDDLDLIAFSRFVLGSSMQI
jgi:hypothetical protein